MYEPGTLSGISARYHHLNVVLGEELSTDSPTQEWDKIELACFLDNPDWLDAFGHMDEYRAAYDRVVSEIVAYLDRCL